MSTVDENNCRKHIFAVSITIIFHHQSKENHKEIDEREPRSVFYTLKIAAFLLFKISFKTLILKEKQKFYKISKCFLV